MVDEIIESSWFESIPKRIALLIILVAFATVMGYVFTYIKTITGNIFMYIEFFTLIVFLSGFLMGKRDGLIVGLASALIYFGLNPIGFPPVGIYLFQVIFYALEGLSGGLVQNYLKNKDYFKPKENLYVPLVMIIFGIVGLSITLIYDNIISIIYYYIYPYGDLISYLINGMAFTAGRLIVNIIEFVLILPGLVMLACKLLEK